MNIVFLLELVVVLAAIALGARAGGVALGLWGGVGVLVLATVFREQPTAPPIDVMLIILAVIAAAAAMEVAGGIDFLVSLAARIIRRFPQHVTIVAPLVAYLFTFGAGTGHVFYPLIPVIHDVALINGIRPERPIAVSTIASQQAITASPVSAAMAALIVILEPAGFGMMQIMAIAVPATLAGVIVAALLSYKRGKELADDPEFQRRVAEGLVEPAGGAKLAKGQTPVHAATEPQSAGATQTAVRTEATTTDGDTVSAVDRPVSRTGKRSALLFLAGVIFIVIAGAAPDWRPHFDGEPLAMATVIEMTMLAVGALIVLINKVPVDRVPRAATANAGFVALVGIFGLAWLGDMFIQANKKTVIGGLSDLATNYPWTFAIGLFFASVLLFSQAATTRALMPLGLSLGIGAPALAAMWPAVNGYFFLPTYGTIIAAVNFDRSGTTRIGRFVLNHSFMMPGLAATITSVAVGLGIASLF